MSPLFAMLVLPIAIENRKARGEGKWEKWQWFAFMVTCVAVITQDLIALLAFGYILAAFAVPPTHSLFSAIDGNPPGRDDKKAWKWMQDIARYINKKLPMATIPEYWHRFAVIYGVIRGCLVIPGYVALYFYTGSPLMLVGMLHLAHGYVYRLFKDSVPAGDVVMGIVLWLGIYLTGYAIT